MSGASADAQQRERALPYLEAHVADHCNLNCRGCGHYSPVSPARLADPAGFERDVLRLAELFEHIERFHLLGGEPLLHPDVLTFSASVRRAFPRARIGLVTNGILLPRMSDDWWREVHEQRVEVRVSAYPVDLDLKLAEERAARHGVTLVVTEMKERFFTIPLRSDGTVDPQRAFELCHELFDCPFLANGRVYVCPSIPLSDLLAERFGVYMPRGSHDSLDIHEDVTAEQIRAFLGKPVPWCRHCDVDHLRWTEWGRSQRCVDEWV